jgi:hypothetical protein
MVQGRVGELNEFFLYGYPIRHQEGYTVVWLSSEFVSSLWHHLALAGSKLTPGGAGGQLIFPDIMMRSHE